MLVQRVYWGGAGVTAKSLRLRESLTQSVLTLQSSNYLLQDGRGGPLYAVTT